MAMLCPSLTRAQVFEKRARGPCSRAEPLLSTPAGSNYISSAMEIALRVVELWDTGHDGSMMLCVLGGPKESQCSWSRFNASRSLMQSSFSSRLSSMRQCWEKRLQGLYTSQVPPRRNMRNSETLYSEPAAYSVIQGKQNKATRQERTGLPLCTTMMRSSLSGSILGSSVRINRSTDLRGLCQHATRGPWRPWSCKDPRVKLKLWLCQNISDPPRSIIAITYLQTLRHWFNS